MCHLNREFERPVAFEAASNAMRIAWQHKKCLHPLAGPGKCDKIVSAHTIQRSSVLERIIDSSNHVFTFYPQTPNSITGLQVHRVGWREASTFTGFCAKHDGPTFKPIETAAFVASKEQCFLVGYRALCHEVFQKTAALRTDSVIRNILDRGLPVEEQVRLQDTFAVMEAGTKKGLAEFQELKTTMDAQLLKKEYPGWSRTVITFRGDICVASTGVVSVNRDFDGRQLQILHHLDTPMESLFCGVAATPEGGAIVLTWPSTQAAPRAFMQSLMNRSSQRLSSLLVQFMFAYIENTVFSRLWWESLSELDSSHLTALAGISNAYYTDFSFSNSKLVPWEITDIFVDAAD